VAQYPDNIKSLTSLRFCAACAIFIYHLHLVLPLAHNQETRLLYKCFLGVDFFFILSGFILTHVYLREWLKGRFSTRSFLIHRLARVYPMHLLTLLAAGAIVYFFRVPGWGLTASWQAFLRNVFLIQTWGFDRSFSFNGPSWSISAEWFAYLLFPFLLPLFAKARPSIAAIYAIWLYATVWILARLFLGRTFTELDAQLGILRILPEFCMGMTLYFFGLCYPCRWCGSRAIAACVALLIGGIYARVPDPLLLFCLAYLILAVAEQSRQGTARLMTCDPFVYLGEISYSFYMIHFSCYLVCGSAGVNRGFTCW